MARSQKQSQKPARGPARKYVTAVAIVSRCPRCKSTERSPYENSHEHAVVGEENGQPYDTVIWRTCRCLKCGQWRVDRSTECRGTK